MTDKKALGIKRMQEILGPQAPALVEKFEAISEDFSKYIVELAYADFYTREGISDKMRETAVVAALIGQGNTGLPLKAHLQGMLNVGHTKGEIIELLLFLIPCVGFPYIVEAMLTAQSVFDSES